MTGPPPRARGPHWMPQLVDVEPGTTPARAGTTQPPTVQTQAAGDHPRVRGDHAFGKVDDDAYQGPPPRARGPPARGDVQAKLDGTTPACAGITVRDLRV